MTHETVGDLSAALENLSAIRAEKEAAKARAEDAEKARAKAVRARIKENCEARRAASDE